jgi:hypothetical protein
LLGYSNRQALIARWINWGWVYSWMSWSLAIAHAKTNAVVIHDLDAMPLAFDLFENIYDHWLEEKAPFCGIRLYEGNGVQQEMGLVRTFELALDAQYVRQNYQPADLFNKLRLIDGRIVDFDTMLDAQRRCGRCAVRPIEEADLVHPSELICHYTNLLAGRMDFRSRPHMLPVLAYLMYLGGDSSQMNATRLRLADRNAQSVKFFGRETYIDGIKPQGWAWMEKQIRRVEQHCFGNTRPDVDAYLRGIVMRAGIARTVGQSEVFPVAEH